MKNDSKSRREFFLRIISGKPESFLNPEASSSDGEQNDKIKMLTPDGKLVEVDREVIRQNQSTDKTKNIEILKWMMQGKDK